MVSVVQVDSCAASGLPMPYYAARKFTRCHAGWQGTLGTRLLSLVGSLVELTLTQQSVDQPDQLASRERACPLVVMRGGLAILSLVVGRVFLVGHPERVRGLHEVVAKIPVAGVHHGGVVGLELAALVLLPDDGSEPCELGIRIKAVDIRRLAR